MPSIEQLETLVQAEPNDTFLHFGLAMEYAKAGRTDDALQQFRRVIELDENYTAAYLHAGRMLLTAGRCDEARVLLTQGRDRAAAAGDAHIRDNIQELLDAMS
jgi:predicted Zn-dependent protease